MSRTRYRVFEREYPYFLTCTVVAWLPLFNDPECAQILLDSWRFLQGERNVRIFGFVILENHVHWIAAAGDLPAKLQHFKSYTARRIIDGLEKRGRATLLGELGFYKARHKTDQDRQVWQEGSHPQQIQNEEMMIQKLEYIHHNPLRRGYVEDPVHWRYSSARNYAGMRGLIEVETDWR
jgi:REP element-mobilizing transposase RayT